MIKVYENTYLILEIQISENTVNGYYVTVLSKKCYNFNYITEITTLTKHLKVCIFSNGGTA